MRHRDLLDGYRLRGEPVPVGVLAAGLLATSAPVETLLARRVVAAALGRAAEALPDPVPADALVAEPVAAQASTPLAAADFAVVDLETTGLSPQRAKILEIGAVRVSGLRIADRFETLVDPGMPVPRGVRALTGITDAMVVGAPPPARALAWLRAWLDLTPDAAFVAHNAAFDHGFVRRGLATHGLPGLAGPVLCTRKLARRLAPELGRFSLDRLADGFGIRNPARHRALGDAEATARALLELLRRAREHLGVGSLGELLALQAAKPRVRAGRCLEPTSGLPPIE